MGSIPEIRRDNVHAFLDAWRGYGDTVRFRGPLTLYLLVHPDAVKQVLQAIVDGGLVGPAVGEILAFANSALTSVVDTARLPLPSTRRFERRLELSTRSCTR